MDEQGMLSIYSIENVAPKGLKPSMKLVKQCDAYYEKRQVGVNRMYSALGAGHRIDALLRCFNTLIDDSWVVIVGGKQFQIDASQEVIGKDAIDLTLIKIGNNYEIYTEQT